VENNDEPSLKSIKQSSLNTVIFRLTGLFLIVGSLSLFALWLNYDFLPALIKQDLRLESLDISLPKQKSSLQILWERDIEVMSNEKILHSGFNSVRKVRVFMLDENLHSQLMHLKAPFRQQRNGQNLLEVSFMSHHSDIDKSEKLIIQYNLTDKDSGNMFWEHSRTITLPPELLTN